LSIGKMESLDDGALRLWDVSAEGHLDI